LKRNITLLGNTSVSGHFGGLDVSVSERYCAVRHLLQPCELGKQTGFLFYKQMWFALTGYYAMHMHRLRLNMCGV